MNAVTPPASSTSPPALTAQRTAGLGAGEGQAKSRLWCQEGLDQRQFPAAEGDRAERHAGHHQAHAGEPARHAHEVQQEARGEEVAQRRALGRVLLEDETEAEQQAAPTARTRTRTDTLRPSIVGSRSVGADSSQGAAACRVVAHAGGALIKLPFLQVS